MSKEREAPTPSEAQGLRSSGTHSPVSSESSVAPAKDSQKAVDFLKSFRPNGPWVLSAIVPDGKIRTNTFRDPKTAHQWIDAVNGGENLYFHVNSTGDATLFDKAKKKDIVAADWLHVDVDPSGDDIEAERAAILDRIKSHSPPPSVVIDSGNGYQAFWHLAEPIDTTTDEGRAEIEDRNRALANALGGDNCHNINRIMRLPGTINVPNKKKRSQGRKKQHAQLVEADWDAVYEPSAFERAEGPEAQDSDEAVTVSLPDQLPSYDLDALPIGKRCRTLIENGCDPDEPDRYPSRSEAVFAVICEMVRNGISDNVVAAVLLDPEQPISAHLRDQKNPRRAAEKQIANARRKTQTSNKPAIVSRHGRLVSILDAAEIALIAGGEQIYQRGGALVRPTRVADLTLTEDGVGRDAAAVIIYEVSQSWMVEAMAKSATWLTVSLSGELVPTDPPPKYARHLLDRAGSWKFPPLRAIIQAPTLRRDGTVLQEPGYDEVSSLLLVPNGLEFPPVPDQPTEDEARAALKLLWEPFALFPFASEEAKSVVMSAILCGLIRRSMRTTPLHGIDAPTAGSGKSLISETVGIIVQGSAPAHMSQGKSAEEDEKRLVSVLRRGDPIISIDNCDLPLEGDFICSMMTQETVQARILGQSETVVLPSASLVLATGNNLTLGGDMSRRAVVCRLDPEDERPDERQFDFDPRNMARDRRAQMVVAGLTALRAYVLAGRPRADLPAVGSFADWSWVRETLVWLGWEDPDATRAAVRAADPRKAEHAELLAAWHAMYPDEVPRTLHQVRADIEGLRATIDGKGNIYDVPEGRLETILTELTGRGQWNGRSIGRHMKRFVDRIVGELVLRRDDQSRDGARWSVERVRRQGQLEV